MQKILFSALAILAFLGGCASGKRDTGGESTHDNNNPPDTSSGGEDTGSGEDSDSAAETGDIGSSTLEGRVNGEKLDLTSAWWGGQLLVLSDQAYACVDMEWASTYYDEEDPPVPGDLTALQFHFSGDEFVPGDYDIAGESVLLVRYLTLRDGSFVIDRARRGFLNIDDVTSGENFIGTYEVEFDTGAVSGNLDVSWCDTLVE